MSVFEQFYDLNPVQVIDQNKWTEYRPGVRTELVTAFRGTGLYTPMISWTPWLGQAQETWETELIPADIDAESISLTTNYLPVTLPFDSRKRKFTVLRYGDKLQLHKSAQYFNQWNFGAGAVNDWRPLMRAVLNNNIVRKHELLSRNIFMRGPTNFWTYAGSATSLGTIGASDTFQPSIVNAWNLRVGNTGNPVVPGSSASAKIVIIPPGVKYDLMISIAAAANNETSLWHDIVTYQDKSLALRNEIGEWKGVRFVEAVNDEFGVNPAVLYNCGAITRQYAVTAAINMGDGAPDPEDSTAYVDNIWAMGQKGVTHYIQLENFGATDLYVGDWVTIHTTRTSSYGVTNGVDPLDTTAVLRRIVSVDASNNRICLDRPLFKNYTAATYSAAGSVTTAAAGSFYAYVTKARHIAMCLVLGSREAVSGRVYKPLQMYEPPAVDDFLSVYRVTWDEIIGYQMMNPHAFEVHFAAVTLPKVGGLITP